jgi:hypothetical protein
MKVIVRGLLAGFFLVLTLLLALSSFTTGLVARLAPAPVQGRLALFILVALAGLLADLLIFGLIPAAMSRTRRLLHGLVMAGVFVVGLLLLGGLDWSRSWFGTGQLDMGAVRPFIGLVVIGFLGYLFCTLLFPPSPGLPSVLARHRNESEKDLYYIRQTRWRHPIAPDTLLATDRRLVVYRPKNFGFTSSLEDYNYIDIANVKIDRGLIFCTVSMKERFQGDDLEFRDMPKGDGERFVREVTEQILQRRGEVPLTSGTMAAEAGPGDEALRTLQQRLAKGEISRQEYEQLRREIERK